MLKKILLTIISYSAFALGLAIPAAAQTSCSPGTTPLTIYGYGIYGCLPATPFSIAGITLSNSDILVLFSIFLAVLVVTVNAMVVRSRFLTHAY